MSKHPKWELKLDHDSTCFRAEDGESNEESGGSLKRSRTSEDESYSIPTNPETSGSGGSTISRPTGRDGAKKNEKVRLARENDIIVAREKLGIENKRIGMETQRIEMESLKMKHTLLMQLLAKDHLSPAEGKKKVVVIVYGANLCTLSYCHVSF
ncbi:hypothetical protein ACS0TY_019933 [Phlomoides rotata]